MTSCKTYEYLVNEIDTAIRSSKVAVRGIGKGDRLLNKGRIAFLYDIIEKPIRGGSGYFLVDVRGGLWVYNGSYYELTSGEEFMVELVRRVLSVCDVGLIYQKYSAAFIARGILGSLRNDEGCLFREDRRYIVFRNGVFDVKRGELLAFSPEYRTDIVLDIMYNSRQEGVLWDNKIREIIPNEGFRDAFQKFCGSLLVQRGELKIEYICYLVGGGSNGKSVAASAIANVFGEKYFGRFSPKQLFRGGDSMFNMAALDGMIANFSDDLDRGDFSGGPFKQFVSGEKFPARHPFGRKVFYVQAPPLLCCTNAMPMSKDESWGYYRRQLVINTTRHVWTDEDKDPYLTMKLSTAEMRSRIFNWIYEGYRKIITSGGVIQLDKELYEVQKEMQEDSSSIRRWIRDSGFYAVRGQDRNGKDWRKLVWLFYKYKQYMATMGCRVDKTARDIIATFRALGYEVMRKSDGMYICLGQKAEEGLIAEIDE